MRAPHRRAANCRASRTSATGRRLGSTACEATVSGASSVFVKAAAAAAAAASAHAQELLSASARSHLWRCCTITIGSSGGQTEHHSREARFKRRRCRTFMTMDAINSQRPPLKVVLPHFLFFTSCLGLCKNCSSLSAGAAHRSPWPETCLRYHPNDCATSKPRPGGGSDAGNNSLGLLSPCSARALSSKPVGRRRTLTLLLTFHTLTTTN